MTLNPQKSLRGIIRQRKNLQKHLEQHDPVKIARAFFSLARQMEILQSFSPLEELRKGDFKAALALTECHYGANQLIWKLLLAWELKDAGRIAEAKKALQSIRTSGLHTITTMSKQTPILYLLTRCTGIDDATIFSILEQDWPLCNKSQFFRYLLSDKSIDGRNAVHDILRPIEKSFKGNELDSILTTVQSEIDKQSTKPSSVDDTFLSKPSTLLQIEKIMRIEDTYDRAYAFSKIIPKAFGPPLDFDLEEYFEYEFYLQYNFSILAKAYASAGKIRKALAILNFLDAHLKDKFDDVWTEIAIHQNHEGNASAARNTFIRCSGVPDGCGLFNSLCDYGLFKNGHYIRDARITLLRAVLLSPQMRLFFYKNQEICDAFIAAMYTPLQHAKADFKRAIEFIACAARKLSDRQQRLLIVGETAVVMAQIGDTAAAMENLQYLQHTVKTIPGKMNKVLAQLRIAEFFAFANIHDQALAVLEKVITLINAEAEEDFRDTAFRYVANTGKKIDSSKITLNMIQNIPVQEVRQKLLKNMIIRRIVTSEDGSAFAEEKLHEINDPYALDEIAVYLAACSLEKKDITSARNYFYLLNTRRYYSILCDVFALNSGKKSIEQHPKDDYYIPPSGMDQLAISSLKAGLDDAALQLAKFCYRDDNVLFKLAAICLQTNQHITFHRIITEINKDYPSACKIAGLLSRHYPEHARVIYKFLLTHAEGRKDRNMKTE